MHDIQHYEVLGDAPPWSVTKVDKFLPGVFARAEHEGAALPEAFHISMCPWGEHNTVRGSAEHWHDVMDPRFRLVHFTGCGRPYLVVMFIGEEARRRQTVAARHLPWSEHYRVELDAQTARLHFLGESEEPEVEAAEPLPERTLMTLFRTGELETW